MWYLKSAVFVLISQILLVASGQEKLDKKPNIIIILADDVVILLFVF